MAEVREKGKMVLEGGKGRSSKEWKEKGEGRRGEEGKKEESTLKRSINSFQVLII